jgi:multiple sugar transport system ATP-binding protein
MRDGRLEQVAPPIELYRRPANAFVAAFVGAPAMNIFECACHRVDGATQLSSTGFALADPAIECPHDRVLLGVRPQDLELVAAGDGDAIGRIEIVETTGAHAVAYVRVGDAPSGLRLRVMIPAESAPALDAEVGIRVRRDRVHLFEVEKGRRLQGV